LNLSMDMIIYSHMGKLIEDISLRDGLHVFEDRKEAGQMLADRLIEYKGSCGVVFGIPSGGVPIASEIAGALDISMDLIIVRKLQIPYNPEAGFGAVDPDGEVILNKGLLNQLRLSEDEIKVQTKKTLDVIKKRNRIFRGGRPYPSLEDKIVIVVDDGLASGYTMIAACSFLRKKLPREIIVAVPTGSDRTVDFVLPEADKLICLNVRSGFSFAVADAYRNWYDLTDKEVIFILGKGT